MMTSRKSARPDPLYLRLECGRFPAQVVEAWHPGFRGKSFVVVEQNPHSHKTLVVSCSTAARRLDIHEGTPLRIVTQRHKDILSIVRNKAWEVETLETLRRLFDQWTPVFTLSEHGSALLDFTGTPSARALRPLELAAKLMAAVLKQSGLQETAAGLSRSRLVARLLARTARPSGIRACEPGNEEAVLSGMDAAWLPGLSAGCREALTKYGLLKIGQLQGIGKESLAGHFGSEGEKLYSLVRGFDFDALRPVKTQLIARTLLDTDINDEEQLMQKLVLTADKFCFELKSRHVITDRMTLALTYADNRRTQKTILLPTATNDFRTVAGCARDAFKALYQRRVAIQSLTLMAHQPQANPEQLSLFETTADAKQRLLADAIMRIRQKTTFSAITSSLNIG